MTRAATVPGFWLSHRAPSALEAMEALRIAPPAEISAARQLARSARWAGGVQRPRVAECGTRAYSARVTVDRMPSGSASVGGLETCGSTWECPCCSGRIRRRRFEEISQAYHEGERRGWTATMMTLTVRHDVFTSLRDSVTTLAAAWARMHRGAPWDRYAIRTGHVGYLRFLEVTYGKNGWHPHLHVVVWHETDSLRAELGWLARRWQAMVRAVAPEQEPTMAVGCDLTAWAEGGPARYCTKPDGKGGSEQDPGDIQSAAELGAWLEVSAAQKGKGPWAILDRAVRGNAKSRILWVEWCETMPGQRLHVWSQSMRRVMGWGAPVADCDLAEPDSGELIAAIDAADWYLVRDRRAHLILHAHAGDLFAWLEEQKIGAGVRAARATAAEVEYRARAPSRATAAHVEHRARAPAPEEPQ